LIQKRKAVDTKSHISLKILPEGRIVQASQTQTILEALQEAEIPMDSSCGGMGTCGTCRLFIEEGLEKLSPRNDPETEIAVDRNFANNERLSCQNFVKDGLVLRKP
jgi:ferredoxin, 2Fe-2S